MSKRGEKLLPYLAFIALRGVIFGALAGLAMIGLYFSSRGELLQEQNEAAKRGPVMDSMLCRYLASREGEPVQSEQLDELSGLVASRDQPGVFWTHNDSGDVARVFAIDLEGRLLAEVTLLGVEARDFEDISIAPRDGADLIYVADTGDNLGIRDHVQLVRFEEPRVSLQGPARKLELHAQPIALRYDDGRARDVETMFIDPRQGDLYLVDKVVLVARDQPVAVFRVPFADLSRSQVTASLLTKVRAGATTSGDISADGKYLAIRNYYIVLWWEIAEGEALVDTMKRPPCIRRLIDGGGGESLTWLPNDRGFVTVAEGKHKPFLHYEFLR